MAQPTQYTGLGGEAPAVVSGVVQEGTEASRAYRESFRAEPFTDDAAQLVPGQSKEVDQDSITTFTMWNGDDRTTLVKSSTQDPCPKVEYGRIQTTLGN